MMPLRCCFALITVMLMPLMSPRAMQQRHAERLFAHDIFVCARC